MQYAIAVGQITSKPRCHAVEIYAYLAITLTFDIILAIPTHMMNVCALCLMYVDH